jgi:hypothetical protein
VGFATRATDRFAVFSYRDPVFELVEEGIFEKSSHLKFRLKILPSE